MLRVTGQLVHAVELLPLLLDRGAVLVATHLGLGEKMVPLVARVPGCNVVVDLLGTLTGHNLDEVTESEWLIWVGHFLMVYLQDAGQGFVFRFEDSLSQH